MGEISMVSCDSPIFQTGKVYYSTLIDENAAAHFAIGSALIGSNLKKGTEIDEDINQSLAPAF
ncbi:MAG: aminopeptidase [Hydrogenoanaerobacterium sp.]